MTTLTSATHTSSSPSATATFRTVLDKAASYGPYAALSIVFLWFGGMKFTAYEAGAIEGLIANSPFIAFTLSIFSAQTVSNLIGIVELAIAALLALRFFNPKLAAIGAAGAALTFVLTFSFFFSTPGVFLEGVSGPAISVLPGQFLLKDLALLALSIFLLNDALKASESTK